jgi:hypothetical protein
LPEAPADPVGDLARAAGEGRIDREGLAGHPPEVVLAAVDACMADYGREAAQGLQAAWIDSMGGERLAGETAHTLLLESRLPHGGGGAALDLMVRVNDPQAILVGLRGFAAEVDLSPSVRMEALTMLRAHSAPGAYVEFVRYRAEQARGEGGEWAERTARLLERLEGAGAETGAVLVVDRALVEDVFGRPYDGGAEDLKFLLWHGVRGGWVVEEASARDALRNALAVPRGLPEADRRASAWLRRWLEGWIQ